MWWAVGYLALGLLLAEGARLHCSRNKGCTLGEGAFLIVFLLWPVLLLFSLRRFVRERAKTRR